jgi:hypothetical protein
VLFLINEISATNEKGQRAARKEIRKLESALGQRYEGVNAAIGYGPEMEIDLDSLSKRLTNCQCTVLQKRPKSWRNAVDRVEKAMHAFWNTLEGHSQYEKPGYELRALHRCLLSRLDFLAVRLEGIESYAYVSLERLKNQREVVSR